jgi:hypothetical protein
MFMRQILDLAQTYQWSEAVLPLALNFHQYILDKGGLSTEYNFVTAPFREKYLRHNLTLPAKSPANPSARPRQTRSARSSNNETKVCDKFSKTGCLWFIRQLQDLAAEKSVRITILGGDVHLAAVGQFYGNKKLDIPQVDDHRYMINIVSSAIVNRPPTTMPANLINRPNKVHHLDEETDEDIVSMFQQDVDGKSRRKTNLLPRRN